jgi:hypothetical protein
MDNEHITCPNAICFTALGYDQHGKKLGLMCWTHEDLMVEGEEIVSFGDLLFEWIETPDEFKKHLENVMYGYLHHHEKNDVKGFFGSLGLGLNDENLEWISKKHMLKEMFEEGRYMETGTYGDGNVGWTKFKKKARKEESGERGWFAMKFIIIDGEENIYNHAG